MLIHVFIFVALFSFPEILHAQTSASLPAATPSIEQRVADLEAYPNNAARGADAANAQVGSNVSGPGRGHNGWMMTAAALVLFMTVIGLRIAPEIERQGLDINEHGEEGYITS
jgi:Amt family ammonium transporter